MRTPTFAEKETPPAVEMRPLDDKPTVLVELVAMPIFSARVIRWNGCDGVCRDFYHTDVDIIHESYDLRPHQMHVDLESW